MPAPLSHRIQFALGFLIAAVGLGAAGELFLRQAAPAELDVYLGARSSSRGAFVADPDLVVRYRSWNDLLGESAADLTAWLQETTRPRRSSFRVPGASYLLP